MFKRAGVVFERADDADGTTLTCQAGAGPANAGYYGFAACLTFDLTGNLWCVEASE